jgi:hypothetical protein
LAQAKDLEIQSLGRQIQALQDQLKKHGENSGENTARDDMIKTLQDRLEEANVWHGLFNAQGIECAELRNKVSLGRIPWLG